jgi:hypothetical protein
MNIDRSHELVQVPSHKEGRPAWRRADPLYWFVANYPYCTGTLADPEQASAGTADPTGALPSFGSVPTSA